MVLLCLNCTVAFLSYVHSVAEVQNSIAFNYAPCSATLLDREGDIIASLHLFCRNHTGSLVHTYTCRHSTIESITFPAVRAASELIHARWQS